MVFCALTCCGSVCFIKCSSRVPVGVIFRFLWLVQSSRRRIAACWWVLTARHEFPSTRSRNPNSACWRLRPHRWAPTWKGHQPAKRRAAPQRARPNNEWWPRTFSEPSVTDWWGNKFILEFYVLCICVCIWVTRIKLLASVFPHLVSDSSLCDRRTKRRSGRFDTITTWSYLVLWNTKLMCQDQHECWSSSRLCRLETMDLLTVPC